MMSFRHAIMVAALALAGCGGVDIEPGPDAAPPPPVEPDGYPCAKALSPWPPEPDLPTAVRVDLDVPVGHRLVRLSAELRPREGHMQLPQSMPRILVAREQVDGSLADASSVLDMSTTISSYETPHRLQWSASDGVGVLAPVFAIYFPESGKGAVTGGVALDWRCTIH